MLRGCAVTEGTSPRPSRAAQFTSPRLEARRTWSRRRAELMFHTVGCRGVEPIGCGPAFDASAARQPTMGGGWQQSRTLNEPCRPVGRSKNFFYISSTSAHVYHPGCSSAGDEDGSCGGSRCHQRILGAIGSRLRQFDDDCGFEVRPTACGTSTHPGCGSSDVSNPPVEKFGNCRSGRPGSDGTTDSAGSSWFAVTMSIVSVMV